METFKAILVFIAIVGSTSKIRLWISNRSKKSRRTPCGNWEISLRAFHRYIQATPESFPHPVRRSPQFVGTCVYPVVDHLGMLVGNPRRSGHFVAAHIAIVDGGAYLLP